MLQFLRVALTIAIWAIIWVLSFRTIKMIRQKYPSRIADRINLSVPLVLSLAATPFLPILAFTILAIILSFLMLQWRDESIAYERYLYTIGDYLNVKRQGWEDTYKGKRLQRYLFMQWEMMSKKEQGKVIDTFTSDGITSLDKLKADGLIPSQLVYNLPTE